MTCQNCETRDGTPLNGPVCRDCFNWQEAYGDGHAAGIAAGRALEREEIAAWLWCLSVGDVDLRTATWIMREIQAGRAASKAGA